MGTFRIKRFSSSDKKKKKKKEFEDIASGRGIGRGTIASLLLPHPRLIRPGKGATSLPLGGIGGIAAAQLEANKLMKEGKLSDEEIVDRAAKRGAIAGGLVHAAPLLALGRGGNPIRKAALAAGGGAVGGYFGAKKNTEDRIKKYREQD